MLFPLVLKNEQFEFIFEHPNFIKLLFPNSLAELCCYIREKLKSHGEKFGGHFASGMGVVELTVALHYSFSFPDDRLIWDTGHQSYPHKILSGRMHQLNTLRQFGGLHPFCSFRESPYDFGISGHAGNSISLALGARWSPILCKDHWVISVIGDGALESGLALEALDQVHQVSGKFLLIINFNDQSIDETIGQKSKIFRRIFSKKYTDNTDFLKMQTSLEVVVLHQGNDVSYLENIFRKMQSSPKSYVLLIRTQKGKGVTAAEKDPLLYHTYPTKTAVLDRRTSIQTYPQILGKWLLEQLKHRSDLRVICPAMSSGSGLKKIAQEYPENFRDVGIAEGHAVAFASGAALAGSKVIVVIYSTFLQRAYDQILHDLAIPSLPVILAVDRAGLVGGDGETHHGIYDLPFLLTIPKMLIFTPSTKESFVRALNAALSLNQGPIAVRYSKKNSFSENNILLEFGASYTIKETETDLRLKQCSPEKHFLYQQYILKKQNSAGLLLNFGMLLPRALRVAQKLNLNVLDLTMAHPFPEFILRTWASQFTRWISIEDGSIFGGIGMHLRDWMSKNVPKIRLQTIGISKGFVPHGDLNDLEKFCEIDEEAIFSKIAAFLNLESK